MLLPVQVTFRNMKDLAGLEEMVQEEAAKLERFYDRISSCRVVVERPQRAESSKLYHVRIDLGLPNGELVVKHTPTLHGTLQDVKADKSRKEAESVLDTQESAARDSRGVPRNATAFAGLLAPAGGLRQEHSEDG